MARAREGGLLTFDGLEEGRAVLGAHSVGVGRLEAAAGGGGLGPLSDEQRLVLVEDGEHRMHTVHDWLALGRDPRRARQEPGRLAGDGVVGLLLVLVLVRLDHAGGQQRLLLVGHRNG